MTDGPHSPTVYRLAPLWQGPWDKIWRCLMAAEPFKLLGPPPNGPHGDLPVVLVFFGSSATNPLCLAADVVHRGVDQFTCQADPLPLSWRLAAVEFGRNLPDKPPSKESMLMRLPAPWLRTAPLRLRPDIVGPVSTFSPTEEFQEILLSLRAGFVTYEALVDEVELSAQELLPFLAGLAAVGIITRAPAPLRHMEDPFEFFGLHWSAHDPLVRQRYEELKPHVERAASMGFGLLHQHLENAFDILHRPEGRRNLRRRIVHAPATGEVVDYLHRRLRKARREHKILVAIDACRRILELHPSDEHARAVLHRLLCRARRRFESIRRGE